MMFTAGISSPAKRQRQSRINLRIHRRRSGRSRIPVIADALDPNCAQKRQDDLTTLRYLFSIPRPLADQLLDEMNRDLTNVLPTGPRALPDRPRLLPVQLPVVRSRHDARPSFIAGGLTLRAGYQHACRKKTAPIFGYLPAISPLFFARERSHRFINVTHYPQGSCAYRVGHVLERSIGIRIPGSTFLKLQ